MLKAFSTSKIQYAISGSEQGKTVFPGLGFEQRAKYAILYRVLAPFQRFRDADQGLLRKCGGSAKDMVSVWRSRTPPVPQTVELRPAPMFTEEIDRLQGQSSPSIVTCWHDHELLNYFLRCPLSGLSGWTIHAAQRLIGFALLKITRHGGVQVGKIADCWLDTQDSTHWQAAVAALTDRLRALSAYNVKCYASSPCLHEALIRNGFVKKWENDVYIRDKQRSIPRELPFGVSMLDANHALVL